LALVIDCAFILIVNGWISAQILTLLQSFGATEGALSIIKPSDFAWTLLAASVVCWVVFGVIKHRMRS
jgi:hypothetical protein